LPALPHPPWTKVLGCSYKAACSGLSPLRGLRSPAWDFSPMRLGKGKLNPKKDSVLK
jgi:hypothetical protein